MLEEGSTESIDVGIRIFNFSDFTQNTRNSFETFLG